MAKPLPRVFIHGEMEKAIRGNLLRDSRRVMEFGTGLRAIRLLEHGEIIRLKDMECIRGWKVIDMKGSGRHV